MRDPHRETSPLDLYPMDQEGLAIKPTLRNALLIILFVLICICSTSWTWQWILGT